MKYILKWAAALCAVVALSASAVMADTTKREDLTFSEFSSRSSVPFWYPAWVAFSIAASIDDDTRVRNIGMERVLIDNTVDHLRIELGWPVAVGLAASSVSSSASSNPFNNITPYIVFGAVVASQSVKAFQNPVGVVFPTTGDSTFYGFYTGVNVNLLGDRARTSSAASSSAAIVLWNVFFNLGWGEAHADGFGGAFSRSDSGLFYEVGSELLFDFGGVFLGPELVWRKFDQSIVEREDMTIGLKVSIPLRRQ